MRSTCVGSSHFATTLFEAKGIEYCIDIQRNIGDVRLPEDYRQHIYLILKEAINNLVKYAHATQAIIEVRFDQHHLTLCVRDNGCGFEIPSPTSGPSTATTNSNPGPAAATTGTSTGNPSLTSGPSPENSSPASGPTVTTPGGNGLPGMYHRASLMNARVDITSAPGQGTSIRLQVDLT